MGVDRLVTGLVKDRLIIFMIFLVDLIVIKIAKIVLSEEDKKKLCIHYQIIVKY